MTGGWLGECADSVLPGHLSSGEPGECCWRGGGSFRGPQAVTLPACILLQRAVLVRARLQLAGGSQCPSVAPCSDAGHAGSAWVDCGCCALHPCPSCRLRAPQEMLSQHGCRARRTWVQPASPGTVLCSLFRFGWQQNKARSKALCFPCFRWVPANAEQGAWRPLEWVWFASVEHYTYFELPSRYFLHKAPSPCSKVSAWV